MATKSTKTKSKWTSAQIKKHVQNIQQVIEQQKRLVKHGESFTAVTPEDIERKLKRTNSPMIISQTGSWTGPTPLGGTLSYSVGLYNPDPTTANNLFAHVWVGPGNVEPTVGTFLLNVDTRFPRLTQPAFAGLMLTAGASAVLSFALRVPSTVENSNYLGNCCLMRFNWHDVGTYLDRGVFVFTVS